MSTMITIANVTMTLQAAKLVEWTRQDVARDVQRIVDDGDCAALLSECLDGCEDADDQDGWREYVEAVCEAAEAYAADPDNGPHVIELANGRRIECDDYEAAKIWCENEWPDCEIGHDEIGRAHV